MKERELREAAECGVCHEKIGKALTFHRVTISRFVFNPGAIQRQSGLEMMGGSVKLAQAFSPNEDLAVPLGDPVTISVCQDCSTRPVYIAELDERKSEEKAGVGGNDEPS